MAPVLPELTRVWMRESFECPQGQTKAMTLIQPSKTKRNSDTQQTIIIEVLAFTSHSLPNQSLDHILHKNHAAQLISKQLCIRNLLFGTKKKEKSAEMSFAHWLGGGGDIETFTSGRLSDLEMKKLFARQWI